jgi:hypothetical protein
MAHISAQHISGKGKPEFYWATDQNVLFVRIGKIGHPRFNGSGFFAFGRSGLEGIRSFGARVGYAFLGTGIRNKKEGRQGYPKNGF